MWWESIEGDSIPAPAAGQLASRPAGGDGSSGPPYSDTSSKPSSPNVFSDAYMMYRNPSSSLPVSRLHTAGFNSDSLVLLVDGAHERSRRWKDVVHKDEDGLLGRKLDSLASGVSCHLSNYCLPDNIDELADGQVCWHEILLLVDGGDIALLDLLADDRDTVRVLLANTLGLCLALV